MRGALLTTINLFLSGGDFDGAIRTIYHEEPPMELRVVSREASGGETVEVNVYRLMRVDPMPIESLGLATSYVFQGTRLSAWSLVDFSV